MLPFCADGIRPPCVPWRSTRPPRTEWSRSRVAPHDPLPRCGTAPTAMRRFCDETTRRLLQTGTLDIRDMHALKARIENGRYVIDEPAALPEGAEVELVIVNGGMSAAERAELLQAIEEAEQDIDAGRVVDEAEVWSRLQAIASSSSLPREL